MTKFQFEENTLYEVVDEDAIDMVRWLSPRNGTLLWARDVNLVSVSVCLFNITDNFDYHYVELSAFAEGSLRKATSPIDVYDDGYPKKTVYTNSFPLMDDNGYVLPAGVMFRFISPVLLWGTVRIAVFNVEGVLDTTRYIVAHQAYGTWRRATDAELTSANISVDDETVYLEYS